MMIELASTSRNGIKMVAGSFSRLLQYGEYVSIGLSVAALSKMIKMANMVDVR